MTSGGPHQGWPGRPDPGQGPEGWPQPGQQAQPPGQHVQPPGQQAGTGQPPAWQQGQDQPWPQPGGTGPQAYPAASGQQYPQYGQQPSGPQYPQYGQQPTGPQSPQYGQQPTGPQYPQYGQQPTGPQYPQYGQQATGQSPQYGQYQGPGQQYGQYQGPGQGYPPGPGQAPPPGFTPPGQQAGGSGGKRRNLPVIITVIAVVVALAAAGLVYLFARKGSETASGGKSTPKDAVVELLGSVDDEDPIGIADQLDPTEAHLFADMTGDVLDQLKRLGVVNKDVSADKVTGVSVTTKDLTYGDAAIKVNDHIQVVELTGGTITLTSGGGPSPYSQKMLDAFPELKQVSDPQTKTVDIAKEAADLGHPIRIATVDRDGKWYPSLFYTLADNWAYQTKGGNYTLDPIGNNGGSSPEDAMNKFVEAISSQDPRAMISVLSPDEMGVLHDYGNLMIGSDLSPTGGLGNAKISNLSWAVSDVTGGKKVSVKTITIKTDDGDFALERDPGAGSLKISVPGQGTINVNADNIDTWITQMVGTGQDLPPQVRDIIKREFSKVIGLGVVMVQGGDGKWYVSPLRTFSDVMVSLLSGLESGDIDYFLSMVK